MSRANLTHLVTVLGIKVFLKFTLNQLSVFERIKVGVRNSYVAIREFLPFRRLPETARSANLAEIIIALGETSRSTVMAFALLWLSHLRITLVERMHCALISP